MPNGRIDFTVGFKADQSGLQQIKASLAEIQKLTVKDVKASGFNISSKELNELKKEAKEIGDIFEKSYSFKLNSVNLTEFKKNLDDAGKDLGTFQKQCSQAGTQGEQAFRKLVTGIATSKTELKETNDLLKSMGVTLANTIKWSIASNAINSVTGAVQKAWSFTKQLDTSLNDIMIVTEKSADSMAAFARQANNAAKNLGASTRAYADAALIYYQQGLSDTEVAARAETTIKAANVTGQSAQTVSEQLTAVWNGYKVASNEAELYIDKLAAVAATTAADLEELSTGMSKVASAANTMGVDIDQLNAQLATVVSVTRQAPETVGTAFKTIYARLGDIEAGLDTETTLGEYTAKMKELGIHVLDSQGKLRDMGSIIEQIGNNWQSLTREQQQSLAITAAGTRQYNNLLSLFNNWDMYQAALKTSENAAGTLASQQEIYLESLEAKTEKLTAATEELYLNLFDSDSFKDVIDLFTKVIEQAAMFTDAIGGGGNALLMLGSIATNVWGDQISQAAAKGIKNITIEKQRRAEINKELATYKEILESAEKNELNDEEIQKLERIIELRKEQIALDKSLTAEEKAEYLQSIENLDKIYNEEYAIKHDKKRINDVFHQLGSRSGRGGNANSFNVYDAEGNQGNIGIDKASERIRENLDIINAEVANTDKMFKTVFNKDFLTQDDLEKINTQINNASNLSKTYQLSSEDLARVTKAQEDYNNAISQYDREAKKGMVTTETGDKVRETAIRLLHAQSEALKEVGKDGEETIKIMKEMAEREEKVNKERARELELQKQRDKEAQIRNLTSGVTDLTSSITGFISVANTASNITDIINDENLTDAEKTQRVLSSLVVTMPMAISAFKSAKEGIGSLSKALMMHINTSYELGIATENLTWTQLRQTIASKGAAAGAKSLGAAMWASLGPYILVAAAIAAVVAALVGLSAAYNKQSKATEEAREATKRAQEGYRAATEEFNKLKQSIEDYRSAKAAIEDLTVGTDEWREAITAANDQVMELIQTYPQLAKYMSNVGGRLEISDIGLAEVEDLQKMRVTTANAGQLGAQRRLAEQESALAKESVARGIQWNDVASFVKGYVKAIPLGGVGTLGEDIIKADFGAAFEDSLNESDLTKLLAIYNEDNPKMFSSMSELASTLRGTELEYIANNNAMLQAVFDAKDRIISLNDTIKINNEKSEALNTAIASLIAANDEDVQNARNKPEVVKLLESDAFLNNRIEAEKQKIEQEKKSGTTATKHALVKEYIAGILGKDASDIEVKNSGGAHFSYRVKGEADWVKGSSYDDLYSGLATQRIKKQGVSKEQVATWDANIDRIKGLNINDAQEAALLSFVGGKDTGSLSGLTENEIQGLIKIVTGNSWLGEALGYHNFSEFAAALGGTYEIQQADIDRLNRTTAAARIGKEQWSNLSFGEQQQADKIVTAVENFAGDSKETLIEGFTNELGKMDDETRSILENADWNSDEFIEKFRVAFSGLGSIALNEIIAINTLANDAVKNFNKDAFEEQVKSVQDILNGLGAVGDTIDKDEYALIDKLPGHLSEFFIELENEDYALTTSAATVQATYEKVKADQLKDTFTTTKGAYDTAVKFTNKSKEQWISENEAKHKKEFDYESKIALAEEREAAVAKFNITTRNEHGLVYIDDPEDKKQIVLDDGFVNQAISLGVLSQEEADAIRKQFENSNYTYLTQKNYNRLVEIQQSLQTLGTDQVDRAYNAYVDSAYNLDSSSANNTVNTAPEKLKGIALQALQGASLKNISEIEEYYGEYLDSAAIEQRKDYLEKIKEDYLNTLDNIQEALKGFENDLQRLGEAFNLLDEEGKIRNLQEQNRTIASMRLTKMEDVKYKLDKFNTRNKNNISTLTSLLGDDVEIEWDPSGAIGNVNEIREAIGDLSPDQYKTATSALDALIADYDQIEAEKAEIRQAFLDELANNAQMIELAVQLELDTKQAKEDYNNFVKDVNDISITGVTAAYSDTITKFIRDSANVANEEVENAAHRLAKFGSGEDGNTGLYTVIDDDAWKNMSESTRRALGEYTVSESDYNRLRQEAEVRFQDAVLAKKELILNIEEQLIEVRQKVQEGYEKEIEYLEEIRSLKETTFEAEELLFGQKTAGEKKAYYEDMITNEKKIVATRKLAYDEALKAYNQMKDREKAGETITDEERESIETALREAGSAYTSSYNDMLQKIKEGFENAIDAALETAFADSREMSKMVREWDWYKKQDSDFLDSVDRAYEMTLLQNKFTELANKNVKAQSQINELRNEEMTILQSKDKLSKADLERAERRLKVLEAEIALQDAQDAKTEMRLVRNADGSYGYQYVANQQDIQEKQNALTQAQYDYYQTSKGNVVEGYSKLYDDINSFKEYIKELSADGELDAEDKSLLEKMWQGLLSRAEGLQIDEASLMQALEASGETLGVDFSAENMPLKDLVLKILGGDLSTIIESVEAASAAATGNADFDAFKAFIEGEKGEGGLLDTVNAIYEKQKEITGTWKTEAQDITESLVPALQAAKREYAEIVALIAGGISYLKLENWEPTFTSGNPVTTNGSGEQPEAASGAYTGDWGDSSGRLMWVHTKELILNKEDTVNILDAVDIVRNIAGSLAMLKSAQVGSLMGAIGASIPSTTGASNTTPVEQSVHITAEFPNVDTKQEIEEAFMELIDISMQKAFEK